MAARIPIAIGIKPNQVATFTNKTISGSSNTLTNIPNSALVNNTISINGSSIPLGGNINLQVQGGSAIVDTDTTYSVAATAVTGGARLDLVAGGSGIGTQSIKFESSGQISVTRIDANTIRIGDNGGLGGVTLTSDSVATLTNKTISGSNNTITSIPNSALVNPYININGTQVALGGTINVASGGGGGSPNTPETLTNKTMSGAQNTFTNIPNSALSNPLILINGVQVPLGTNLNVTGLGDVTTTGEQTLSNKSLTSPNISSPRIVGTINLGSAPGNPGTNGQILTSTGAGLTWSNQGAITAGAVAALLTIGSGLASSGATEYNGSNGITISVDTNTIATLNGIQTLANKTLNNAILTGTVTAGGGVGTNGQILTSTGTGVSWTTPTSTAPAAGDLTGATLASNVVSSSLTSVGTLSGGLNIATGQTYKINSVDVLNATTLGSGITTSSLTSVGTLTSLTVSGAVSISGTNNLTINNGNVIFSTSGKGLDFTATTNSTGTVVSEVFSDYEEGTFTPTTIGATSAGTGTYTKQVGRYTKIGNRVFYQITVATSAHTGSGNMTIGGLPFTSNSTTNNQAAASFYHSTLALSANSILQGYIAPNSTAITLQQVVTAGGTAAAVTLDATCEISVQGSYEV